MKNEFNFLIVILLLIVPVKAQSSETNLTGNLSADSKILFEENNFESLPQLSFQTENKKSPLLAGILSLVLPGAGEFYVGDYLKTAIFLTIEAAVITTAVIYDNKGNDQTDFFQKYANENWSVVRYADWIKDTFYGGEDPGIVTNRDPPLPPWKQVDWNRLKEAEREKNVGSHHLPL